MRIARGGGPIVGAFWVAALALAIWTIIAGGGPIRTILTVVMVILAGLTLWFFRDPEQDITSVPADLVIAPGQGRVMTIEEVEEPDHMGGRCRRISIFLSILDVHVQRAPVAGRVTHRSRRDGSFLAAWNPRAGERNARASIGIDSEHGPVLVRQITGLVARRILTYPAIGDHVDRGERVGLIRFGSRVDLFLPLDWTVLCSPGDRAVAGLTPVAQFPGDRGTADA